LSCSSPSPPWQPAMTCSGVRGTGITSNTHETCAIRLCPFFSPATVRFSNVRTSWPGARVPVRRQSQRPQPRPVPRARPRLRPAVLPAARQLALAYGVTAETRSSTPDLGEFADGATALGIVIAFGVLAASVGLIRSETERDLRTLTATGASSATRRMITAATAAALGLLGAVLGMAVAVIAGLAWAHSSLSVMFGGLPLTDVLVLLAGLPLAAAAGGWLLAGREPDVISRQPLD